MSGLLLDHRAIHQLKSPTPEIILPVIPRNAQVNDGNMIRSKTKKKSQRHREKHSSRKKRSKSCPAGPQDTPSRIEIDHSTSLSKIQEEGRENFEKQNYRLPSILENRRNDGRFSFACSSEIDDLFQDKLNIKDNGSADSRCTLRKYPPSDRPSVEKIGKEYCVEQIKAEEKKKPSKKVALLVSIKPENQDSEKEKFMQSKFTGNPAFEYKYIPNQAALDRFRKPSDKLIHIAIKIMKSALREFGTYENFEEKTGGRKLTQTEISQAATEYLRKENMAEEVVLRLSDDIVSRACMSKIKGKPTLQVRMDNIRENWMSGLLRHEIGTHYLRSYNNLKQPWGKSKKRKRFELRPLNPTEEGLASLHSVLFRKSPCLFRCALLYYTAYQASHMSFADLFRDIGQFLKDPNTRWSYCLRAKRGQTDTSRPGAFCKDQVYLNGAMEILKNRRSINFYHLVKCGKVDFRDVARIHSFADLDTTRVPGFMEDMGVYMEALDDIVVKNGLTDSDFQYIS